MRGILSILVLMASAALLSCTDMPGAYVPPGEAPKTASAETAGPAPIPAVSTPAPAVDDTQPTQKPDETHSAAPP